MDKVIAGVTVLIALSVASERLVEIVKGMFQFLSQQQTRASDEARRKVILHMLAVVAGILVAWLGMPAIRETLPGSANVNQLQVIVALGVLSSGGSGMWNTVLTYLLNLKNAQKAAVAAVEARQAAAGIRPLPQPTDQLLAS